MKKVKLHIDFAGYCLARARHAVKGDPDEDIRFRAMFALIEHPEQGWILFDTGYTRRFHDATRRFPNSLYARLTKVFITREDEVSSKLQAAGILPEDVRFIILSHFHADHIGGLLDFPQARILVSGKAWDQARNIPPALAVTRGILKPLLPSDLAQRIDPVESMGIQRQDAIWGVTYDLFADGSILAFDIPGHAAGQIGIRVQTTRQTYLLVADACWDKRAFMEQAMPDPIVRLFFDSWKDYKRSLEKVTAYHQRFPEHRIVPSHCYTSYRDLLTREIDMDVL